MHVICKSCGAEISVAYKPKGHTSVQKNVRASGNVRIDGGGISFGSGGGISFGPGGGISFGAPIPSEFKCMECGENNLYEEIDFIED